LSGAVAAPALTPPAARALVLASAPQVAVAAPVVASLTVGQGLSGPHLSPAHPEDIGRRASESSASEGVSTALRWNTCSVKAKDIAHPIDSIASSKHQFLYVDNVKAGSSSIRGLLQSALGVHWKKADMKIDRKLDRRIALGRTMSTYFLPDEVARSFRFSFVRDPVAKFESGVRQAWAQDGRLKHLTADELLDRQLQLWASEHEWVNEHLQPSSWRLSAYNGGAPVHLDFVGKLESITEQWAEVVTHFTNVSMPAMRKLKRVTKANSRGADPRSRLSASSVARMCSSELYGSEWECFGYPRPAACSP